MQPDLEGFGWGETPTPAGPVTGLAHASEHAADTATPGATITRYLLRDASGADVATHVRHEHPGGRKTFTWQLPDGTYGLAGVAAADLPLYGVERLGDWRGLVVIVEGEKAAEALWAVGVQALGTVTGSSGTPGQLALGELSGRLVYLWPDNDEVGRGHMERIAASLRDLGGSVRWVVWPDAPAGGDAADLLASGTSDDVAELLDAATAWTPGHGPAHAEPQLVATMKPPPASDAYAGDGAIGPHRITGFVGRTGVGKSQLRKAIEQAAATGGEAIGLRFARPLMTLVLEADNGPAEEFRRDDVFLENSGIERAALDRLYRVSWPGLLLERKVDQVRLRSWITSLAIDLLILDPIGQFYAVKEVREELKPIVDFLRDLQMQRPSLAIVFFHHFRKGQSGKPTEPMLDDVRGAEWADRADVVVLVSSLGERRLKLEYLKRIAPMTLILEQDSEGPFHVVAMPETRDQRSSRDDKVIAAVDAGCGGSIDELMRSTGLTQSTVNRALHDLRAQGILTKGMPARRPAGDT